jgi:N-acetylmuramoyl-L-alanine amidase
MIGKRGTAAEQAVMGTLQELFIALIIGLVFITVAVQTANSDSLQKTYLSRVIGMTTTVAQATPGQLLLTYSPKGFDLSLYQYVWENSLLSVDPRMPKQYPYLWNRLLFFGARHEVWAKDALFFYNDLSSFNVSNQKSELIDLLNCEDYPFSPSSIFIDPGHGLEGGSGAGFTPATGGAGATASDQGYTSGGLIEAEIVCELAALLSEELNDYKLYSSRPLRDPPYQSVICQNTVRKGGLEIEDDIEASDLVISLHIGNFSKHLVRAFVAANDHFPEASSIACRSLNKLKQEFPSIKGIMVIPYEGSEDPLGHFSILDTDGPAIAFELGSLNSAESREMLNEKARLAKALAGGLI